MVFSFLIIQAPFTLVFPFGLKNKQDDDELVMSHLKKRSRQADDSLWYHVDVLSTFKATFGGRVMRQWTPLTRDQAFVYPL